MSNNNLNKINNNSTNINENIDKINNSNTKLDNSNSESNNSNSELNNSNVELNNSNVELNNSNVELNNVSFNNNSENEKNGENQINTIINNEKVEVIDNGNNESDNEGNSDNEDNEGNSENEDNEDNSDNEDNEDNSDNESDDEDKSDNEGDNNESDNENNSDDESDIDEELDFSDDINFEDSDDDIFGEEEIEVDEVEVVPEEEMVYKDDIYLDDLLDSYMALEPIYKRNNKYTEDRLSKKVNDIINFKNESLKNVKLLKEGIKYQGILDYINGNFSKKWAIPVINDNKIIYSKMNIETNKNNDNDDVFLTDTVLEDNIKIIKQTEQFKMLKDNEQAFNKNKQNFKSYINKKLNIITAYNVENKNMNLQYSTNLIRKSYIDTINWKNYIGLEPIDRYSELINEETNEIIKVKKNKVPLYPGEPISLCGFLILPYGRTDINDYLFINSNSQKVLQRFGKIGKITNIKNKNPVEITVQNHNLVENQPIYISNSNCNPNIDNIYHKIKIIDENTISININSNLLSDGDFGYIYSVSTIKYEEFEITFNKDIKIKQIIKMEDNKIEYPKLYSFKASIVEDKEKYKSIIENIIPNIDNIISLEYPYLSKCKTLQEVNQILNKYSLNYNNIYVNHIKIVNKILNDNLNNVIESYEKIKNKNINTSNPDNTLFKDDSYILSDKYINNTYILKYYNKYLFFNTKNDIILNRLKWLNSQRDNGILYLQYINKLISSKIEKKEIYAKIVKYKKNI